MLFLLVIDWIMKTTTEGSRTGIQWSLLSLLHDLDFADDIALLSHNHKHAQDKVQSLATTAGMTGLTIKKSKTKTMRINSTNERPIKLDNEDIENVASFTYLGSVIAIDGGTERDVRVRNGKARTAFLLLRPVWRSNVISLRTKLRIFNTNVKSVLKYGAETWRVTKNNSAKIQALTNRCLRNILGVRWPNTISNEDLLAKTQEEIAESQSVVRSRLLVSEVDQKRVWTKTGVWERKCKVQERPSPFPSGSRTSPIPLVARRLRLDRPH